MADVAALGLKVEGVESIERVREALGRFVSAGESAERSANKLGNESTKVKQSIDGVSNAAGNASGGLSAMGAAALKAGGMLSAVFSINALKNYADSWSDMKSVVGAAIGDMSGAGDMMTRLVDIANASYSPLAQTAETYSRNVSVLRELGKTSGEAADFTESLNHMLVLTATRGERASTVQNALSKAMAVGKLQADGLETVLANGGEVARALANELGTTVNGLRQFASEGRITGEVIANAIIKPLDDVRERAGEMPATIEDAFVRIQTNTLQLAGALDTATGASSAFANAVTTIADGLGAISSNKALMEAVGVAAKVVAGILVTRLTVSLMASAGGYIAANIEAIRYQATLARMAGLSNTAAVGITAVGTASRFASAGLALLGGNVGAVIFGLGAAVAAFSYLTGAQDDNKDSIDRLSLSVDAYVERLQNMSKIQLGNEATALKKEIDEQVHELERSVYSIDFGTRAANGFRHMFLEVARQTELTKDQMDSALQELVNKYQNESVFKGMHSDLEKLANNILKQKDLYDELIVKQNALGQAMENVGNKAASIDFAPKGMEKWDEYLAKLMSTRDMIGMSARELGEYQAAQAGANNTQAQMAGIVSAEADEFRKLQTAIQNKQTDAAAAAIENIRNLDLERQRVALLTMQMNSVMAAARAFAAGNISADIQAGIFTHINEGYAQAANNLKPSAAVEEQIKRMQTNTLVKGSGGKGGSRGGGGSKASNPVGDYIKQMQEQIALVGKATEYEKALANIQLGKYGKLSQHQKDEILGYAQTLDFVKQTTEELEKRKRAFGDSTKDADKYILGDTSPLSGGAFDNQIARYEAEAEAERNRYQGQMDRLIEARELQIQTKRSYDELEAIAAQQHSDRMNQIDRAKTSLMMSTTSDAFGAMADIMRQSQGEQSGIYKAMFAASKAFAVANATVNAYDAISKAWASAPFPANLAAVAATAPQVMALISAISGTGVSGMAHDGIDSIPETGTWLLEKGERVVTSKTSARLDSVLERIDAQQRISRAEGTQNASNSKGITVNVIENKDRAGEVVERTNESGDQEADVFVADIFGEGKRARALEQAYGLARVGR